MICQTGWRSLNHGDNSLPISALQHWLFCPRQFALIHVERLWAENRLTAEGRVLHQRADAGGKDKRGTTRTLRAVELASQKYGLHGVADVVELVGRPARPMPVEYKRGRPKAHSADEVQLCAQALCLEEMFDCTVENGTLYYGQNRRRKSIAIDATLRKLTLDAAEKARATLASGRLPEPEYAPRRCDACSLISLCRPKSRRKVAGWFAASLANAGVPE